MLYNIGTMAIKNNLSTLLGQRKMKMMALAKQAGISRHTVYGFYHETNKRIDYDTLDKICKVLGCSVGDILEYVPDEE